MRLGHVRSDKQAFRQIFGRLKNEVGTMLQLIEYGRKDEYFKNTAPFWSLVRMLFPIVESLGDLIHRNNSTVQNLIQVLETEFENERPGYKGKAATLAVLYRHSLTHQDELRSLKVVGRECRWWVGYDERGEHLKVIHKKRGIVIIRFDTTAFYDDTVKVCRTAMKKSWGGAVMKRYNAWLLLDLTPTKGLTSNEKAAKLEIASL